MAGLSKDTGDDSQLFMNVFTEGPLEELKTKSGIITTASLVGSSKLFLDSAKDSATLPASLPFGLPCVLHSHHLTKRLRDQFEYLINGSPRVCKLTPLDRFSSDAVIPDGCYDQLVGANGDWITEARFNNGWELVNVYTHRMISLPAVTFEATNQPYMFILDNGDSTLLKKIPICQVPTAAKRYQDFSLLAFFDTRIAVLHGHDSEWIVLLPHHSMMYDLYSNAIIHNGLVFAIGLIGEVHAWDILNPGPALVLSQPPGAAKWVDSYTDALDHKIYDHKHIYGMWWLASSADGSRLLQIKTLGTGYHQQYQSCLFCQTVAAQSSVVHCGRTVNTYAFGFGCLVFSMDTSQLVLANPQEMLDNPWERITDLGEYSLFLGVNYPIILPVGGADLALGYLTRSNCVYTLPSSAWECKTPLPKICRFSLNDEEDVGGFSTCSLAKGTPFYVWGGLVKTPLWFIPSFANALDWNRPGVYL